MTVTDELRGKLRARQTAQARRQWFPPTAGHFLGDTLVMPWDATLSHCAWVVAQRVNHTVHVYDKGTINVSTGLTGYASTWEKARLLLPQVREVLDTYPGVRVVVEAPAVRGSRLESSLIAGMLIWLETVAPSGTGCPQISPGHVSAVLCGDGHMPSAQRKRAVKAAIARYVPGSDGRSWNEHERDALAVGLTWLYDQEQRQGQFKVPSFT